MISFRELNFNKAVKAGNLEKSDKKYVDEIEKRGYKIKDFIITSKGYELTIASGREKKSFIGKTPEDVLKKAIKGA